MLEFHLRVKAKVDKLTPVTLPFVQSVKVSLSVGAVNDERCDAVTQTFLEDQQPADQTVVLGERTDTLEPVMEVENVLQCYYFFAFVLFDKRWKFLVYTLRGSRFPIPDLAVECTVAVVGAGVFLIYFGHYPESAVQLFYHIHAQWFAVFLNDLVDAKKMIRGCKRVVSIDVRQQQVEFAIRKAFLHLFKSDGAAVRCRGMKGEIHLDIFVNAV